MQEAKDLTEDPKWVRCVSRFVAEAAILNEDVERAVRDAFAAVPRAGFSDPGNSHECLDDVDLPLANGGWLTKPSLMARMMGLIGLRRRMRILELGFGSGYLCAVMASAGAQVFGLEADSALAQASRKQLDTFGLHGIVVRRGDGRKGWEEVAPFDAIVCSYVVAEDGELPLSQLVVGGVLAAPLVVGDAVHLAVWNRTDAGFRRIVFEAVNFR